MRRLIQCFTTPHRRGIPNLCPGQLSTSSFPGAVVTRHYTVLTSRSCVAHSHKASPFVHYQYRNIHNPRINQRQPGGLDPDLNFTSQDVPMIEIWQQKQQDLLKAGMEADAVRFDSKQYIEEAVRFADEIAKAGAHWRPVHARDLGFSASDLYYMAVLLRTPPSESRSVVRMSKQMLISAVEMGHGPAIITMTNLAFQDVQWSGKPGLPQRRDVPEFWRIVDRFTKYAQHAKQDPNVLTLSGMLALAQGDRAKAIKYLSAAETLGNATAVRRDDSPADAKAAETGLLTAAALSATQPRRPRWDLESQALLGLGVLREKSGHRDAAKAAFLIAARELDVAEACLRLALLLSPENPAEARDREILLSRAAMSGVVGAFIPLAEMEWQNAAAAQAAGSVKAAAYHKAMAKQWINLATGE